jgi:hypothetical protein
MRSLFLINLALLVFIPSCSSDESEVAIITGVVEYVFNNQPLGNVPLKLIVYDNDIPFDRNNPSINVVHSSTLRSGKDGFYNYEIDLSQLPKNLSYQVYSDTSVLINSSKLYSPGYCTVITILPIEDRTLRPGKINSKIYVDDATFIQLIFKKIDPLSMNRINYSFCLMNRETTIEEPDTTFLDNLPLSFYPNLSISYNVIKDSGEVEENLIQDILLLKHDTTKVIVNY